MTRLFALRPLTALLLALLVSGAARAFSQAVPASMNFQGRLARPDGTPVPDNAAQPVTFRLFAAATGGTALWSQSRTVAVRNGTFAVALDFTAGFTGANTLASVFAASPYLEIQVGSDAPLTPRQVFRSVAYAFNANTANTVPSGSIGLNQLASGLLNFSNIGGTLGANQIAAGSITGDKLASGAVTFGNLNSNILNLFSNPLLTQATTTINLALRGATPDFPGYTEKVVVSGNYAYVPNSDPGGGTSNTLNVVDVSNPANPIVKTSVATAGRSQGIALSGNYIYFASNNTLQVFDVSNPLTPVVRGATAIPAPLTYPVYPVAVSGSTVCILTSSGLTVCDVSNPNSPVLKASVGTASYPTDLAMQGNNAYVSTQDPHHTLQIFDVSNTAAPVLKGQSVNNQTYSLNIAVQGNYAYVTNNGTNGANIDSLQIYDVSDPANPVIKSTTVLAQQPGAIAVSGSAAYILLYPPSGTGTLLAFDVSNPNNPVLLKSVGTGGDQSSSVAIQGNYAYVMIAYKLQVYAISSTVLNSTLTLKDNLTFSDGTAQRTAGLVPGSAAGGDLSGTYPNPTLATLASSLAKVSGGVLSSSGGNIASTGSVTASSFSVGAYSLDQRFGGIAAAGFTVDKNGAYTGALGSGGLLLLGSYGLDGIASNHNNEDMDFYTAASKKMTLTAGGYLGIGTAAPAYRVELPNVNSNDGKGRANAWVTYSSGRWKNHVAPIENPLEKVLAMRGVMFDWLPEYGGGHDIGFVAEEAGAVVPELAVWERDGKFAQGLKYDRVTALLVEAVKTQQKQIEDLKAQLKEMDALKKQMATLAEAMQKMQKPANGGYK